jgi:hypothetical protein
MMPMVIALLAPVEVCMPPPLNILHVSVHCCANMKAIFQTGKFLFPVFWGKLNRQKHAMNVFC